MWHFVIPKVPTGNHVHVVLHCYNSVLFNFHESTDNSFTIELHYNVKMYFCLENYFASSVEIYYMNLQAGTKQTTFVKRICTVHQL